MPSPFLSSGSEESRKLQSRELTASGSSLLTEGSRELTGWLEVVTGGVTGRALETGAITSCEEEVGGALEEACEEEEGTEEGSEDGVSEEEAWEDEVSVEETSEELSDEESSEEEASEEEDDACEELSGTEEIDAWELEASVA